MNVFFFWEPVGGLTLDYPCNPYAGLLQRELARLDIHLQLGDYEFSREWLEVHHRDYEVLHLNWLHHFYRRDDLAATIASSCRFADNLAHARRLGYRIIWTMHNLYPHERPFPEVDHMTRLHVCRTAHATIAHCRYAAQRLRELFYWEKDVEVIPHGHFMDVYVEDLDVGEARSRLGLDPKAFVYLFFGNARAYKGIHDLIAAFARIARQGDILLLMLRTAFDRHYATEIENLAGGHPGVQLHTSPYFADGDFQIYLKAADVVALPFSEVLTSGSAITALGFGKPLIMPKLGCLPELLDEQAGILYDTEEPRALESALGVVRDMDLDVAGRRARACAKALDWGDIARRIASVYRQK